MSLNCDNHKIKIPKLENAAGYGRWRSALSDHIFSIAQGAVPTNIDMITIRDILHSEVFKKKFPNKYNAAKHAVKDEEDDESFDHAPYLEFCAEHARKRAEGYYVWVYRLFADIRASLSEQVHEQTAGVNQGDIPELFKAIKLAICFYEVLDSTQLEIQYASCTMSGEGKNDVMKYLSVLKQYRNRLETAGVTVSDNNTRP